MTVRHLFISVLALSATLPIHAQERVSSMRTSARPQSAAEVEDIGEISETPGTTTDGKTAAAPPEPKPVNFRFSASTRAAYTSNAQLSGNHGSNDFLFFPSIEAGYSNEFKKGFTFDVAARVESGLYARYDDRAFIGYSATATLDWRPRPTSPRIFISAEPYRYDNFDKGGLLTEAVGLCAGTDWGIPFNNGNSVAILGYNFTHYLSDPGIDTRNSNRAVVGVTHTLRPQVYGQLLYSYNYDNYTDFDRRDSRHIIAANVTWQVNRQLFATVGGSFVDNDSTQDHASYQSAGASLQITWHF
jgi:hypothetical protein